jgi:hypothetical protein
MCNFTTNPWQSAPNISKHRITVNNTTDGSSGVITANTETTVTAVLSGGTENDWDNGDSYTITPTGLDQDIAQGEKKTFVYDGEGWQ